MGARGSPHSSHPHPHVDGNCAAWSDPQLSGHPSDTSVLPLVTRLVQSVEGVVDVRFELR
jgi:hypothetical protein